MHLPCIRVRYIEGSTHIKQVSTQPGQLWELATSNKGTSYFVVGVTSIVYTSFVVKQLEILSHKHTHRHTHLDRISKVNGQVYPITSSLQYTCCTQYFPLRHPTTHAKQHFTTMYPHVQCYTAVPW